MIPELSAQPVPFSSLQDADEPTEPRILAQREQTGPPAGIVQVRQNSAFTVSIDEQGIVTVGLPGRDDLIWSPEEAFDLLDFLFAYRNLLAARSAERAERRAETHTRQ